MTYKQRKLDNIRAILKGAQSSIEMAMAQLDILESQIVQREKAAPEPEWTIAPRFDLADDTWEVSRPSEHWTVTIRPFGKPFCGCGKEKCEHYDAVLRRHYSPAHPDLD